MDFGLKNIDIEFIIEVFKRTPEVEKALIFGSRSKQNHKVGSDIDLAICGKDISFKIVSHLHYILEEESCMPYFVDIVDLTHLQNSALKKQIEEEGTVIYEKSVNQ